MPPKSVLPSREKLIAMREQGMSNQQIGDIYGVRHDYVSQVISKGFNHYRGRIKDVDPRDYLPELAPYITDEMVAEWRRTRTCLCGCGTPSTIRNSKTSGGPRGSYTYFAIGHVNRFGPYQNRLRTKVLAPDIREKIRAAKLAEAEPAAPLIPIINEFLYGQGMRVYELAQQTDMDATYLSEVRAGSKPTVRKDLKKKFLEGLEEPTVNPWLISGLVTEHLFEVKLTAKKFASRYDLDIRWLNRVLDGSQKTITRLMAAKLLTSIGEPLTPELQKYAPPEGRRLTRKRVV